MQAFATGSYLMKLCFLSDWKHFGRGDRTAPSLLIICNEIRRLEGVFAVTCTLTNTHFSALFARLAALPLVQAIPCCSNVSRV